MKKIVLICVFLLTISGLQAQIHKHALGLRLGGDRNYNRVEISFQGGINKMNRMEVDLGFSSGRNYHAFFLTTVYQWVWDIATGFNAYAGPGLSLGLASVEGGGSSTNIGIGGQVGIEYDFNSIDAPIALSLDVRPIWNITGDSGFGWGFALGVRYTW